MELHFGQEMEIDTERPWTHFPAMVRVAAADLVAGPYVAIAGPY